VAEGLSAYTANAFLNALGNNTSFAVATVYMQLHTAAPGSAGTANQATETSRKAVTFGTPSAGSMTNDAAVTWTNISGNQDANHASFWDLSTGGNFLFSGTITASSYNTGDTYQVDIGGVTVSFTLAS